MFATSLVLWLAALGADAQARPASAEDQVERVAPRAEPPAARGSKKPPAAAPRSQPASSRPKPSATPKPTPRPISRPPPAKPRPAPAAPRPAPAPRAAPRPAPAPRAAPKSRPAPAPRAAPVPRSQPAPRAAPAPRAEPTPRLRPPPGAQPAPRAANGEVPAGRAVPLRSGAVRPSSGLRPAGVGEPVRRDDLELGAAPSRANLRPYLAKSDLVRPGDASAPGSAARPTGRPPHRDPTDSRYARPTTDSVRPPPYAHDRVPVVRTYRSYYTRWYCHPWYRYRYSTVAVVWFDFTPYPWYDWWIPPPRWGWTWVPGGLFYGHWDPGYWAPVTAAPVGYVYVPGWWESDAYVEGYYRVDERDGWEWVDGYYLDDGTAVRGHWAPTGPGPEGYVWEPGFWDGETYIDGFWRPEFRADYTWASAYYDADGVFHAGYWMPLEERPGFVWIPGWFDGNEWIAGYWVPEEELDEEAVEEWQAPEGVRDGWATEKRPEDYVPSEDEPVEAQIIEEREEATGEAPLAIPVVPEPAPEE